MKINFVYKDMFPMMESQCCALKGDAISSLTNESCQ
jgi:hypothetical protein